MAWTREQYLQYQRSYNLRNRARKLEQMRSVYRLHPEDARIRTAEWKRRNPERFRFLSNESKKKWESRNPGAVRAKSARKRVVRLSATPSWVDQKEIEKVYVEAVRLTRETGIPHEVDHIWPLRGQGFNGLHVPWNLQILTRAENLRKGNRRPL